MNQTLDVQELSLVIAVERQDPSVLTPDFLRYSDIIPQDWELATQPVRSQQGAQVSYQNGVSILAYPNRTVFVESIAAKPLESVEIARIAQRYSEVLRNLPFQASGVNLRGHALFPGDANAAHQYLCNTLLSPGHWQTLGSAPMRAGLNLVYTFERNLMNLSVQEAIARLPEQEQVPVVLFTANFETPLKAQSEAERLTQLHQSLQSWQIDLAKYREVVEQLLVSKQTEQLIFPMSPLSV